MGQITVGQYRIPYIYLATNSGIALLPYTVTSSTPASTPTSTPISTPSGNTCAIDTENVSNVFAREKYEMRIFKDKTTSYVFTDRRNPVKYVNITGNSDFGNVETSVEVLANSSSLVMNIAPGYVYKNMNIRVGNAGFAVPKNIKEAVIIFAIENSWFDSNKVARGNVMMVRWDQTRWVALETAEKAKNEDYTYFEAHTDSFSSFAITVIKDEIVPKASAPITETATGNAMGTAAAAEKETETNVPTAKTPGFEIVLASAGILAVYVYAKRMIA